MAKAKVKLKLKPCPFCGGEAKVKRVPVYLTSTDKKIKADGYFALTGTPIENSLSELWSIFDFVMKGYLYSYREFTKKFQNGIHFLQNLFLTQIIKLMMK